MADLEKWRETVAQRDLRIARVARIRSEGRGHILKRATALAEAATAELNVFLGSSEFEFISAQLARVYDFSRIRRSLKVKRSELLPDNPEITVTFDNAALVIDKSPTSYLAADPKGLCEYRLTYSWWSGDVLTREGMSARAFVRRVADLLPARHLGDLWPGSYEHDHGETDSLYGSMTWEQWVSRMDAEVLCPAMDLRGRMVALFERQFDIR